MIKRLVLEEPPVNRKEVFRYARVKESSVADESLLDECIAEARKILSYRIVYSRFIIEKKSGYLQFSTIRTSSATVSKALSSCDEVILFASTVGAELDRLILRYSRLSPSKALMLQALGAERVESLCDAFCDQMKTELRAENKSLKTRVSPGYGDIPLSMQKDFFAILDCERKIGLTLNENLMMSPSKSVTALMGVYQE